MTKNTQPAAPATEAPKASDTVLASFIWKNAEDLWGDFKHTDFGKIILPFTLLRRLDISSGPFDVDASNFRKNGSRKQGQSALSPDESPL